MTRECDMSRTRIDYMCVMCHTPNAHSYVGRYSRMCVTSLIRICNVTRVCDMSRTRVDYMCFVCRSPVVVGFGNLEIQLNENRLVL